MNTSTLKQMLCTHPSLPYAQIAAFIQHLRQKSKLIQVFFVSKEAIALLESVQQHTPSFDFIFSAP